MTGPLGQIEDVPTVDTLIFNCPVLRYYGQFPLVVV